MLAVMRVRLAVGMNTSTCSQLVITNDPPTPHQCVGFADLKTGRWDRYWNNFGWPLYYVCPAGAAVVASGR